MEQIRKLNCDRCKLRTEHYVLSNEGMVMSCLCLKCGQHRANGEPMTELESYPLDESRPAYVL